MSTINWGIIGCGDVTEVKSGPAFNKVPNSKLVAVMRRDAAKAADYAQRHQVGKWYSNADDLINDPEVNAIYIATPPLHHEEYTIAALRAGKPVYVEKPMAMNADSARRMQQAADDTGVKLTIAHYRREIHLFKKIKQLLSDSAIGNIRFVDLKMLQPDNSAMITKTPTNWRVDPAVSGGGLFHDLAPHQLDLMLYFFGDVVKANGIALNQANLYKADDLVTASLQFENGVVFNGMWCFTVPPQLSLDSCEIIGSKGKMSFSIFNLDKLHLQVNGNEQLFTFDPLQHVQQPMIQEVVQYFLGNVSNPCPAQDGVEVMRIMDMITKRQK
jgi:predicted dehydrogenase